MPIAFPQGGDLPFPGSLPEFQQLFPDDLALLLHAAYLEAIRWPEGFVCQWRVRRSQANPIRFQARPHVSPDAGNARKNNRITWPERSYRTPHTLLSVWFLGCSIWSRRTRRACLPSNSSTPTSTLKRYETAFRGPPQAARRYAYGPTVIGSAVRLTSLWRLDESLVGGATRGQGRGVHDKTRGLCGVKSARANPRSRVLCLAEMVATRVNIRLEVVPDRSAKSLVGFVEAAGRAGSRRWP